MAKIAPSILSADFLKLGEEIREAEAAGADLLHIDIMDGHFVPNLTIGPSIVEAIRKITSLPLDVHLMIEDPDKYLMDFIKAGADYVTVHYEALVHLHRTVNWIRENGIKAGVSLNPATPVWSLQDIIADADMILLMSVNPGFGGQNYIPQTTEKIRALRELINQKGLRTLIEVDGGIKISNAREVISAGADILVMGSGFFNAEDYGKIVRQFRDLTDSR
jgi:ribulose-phosphate 3-epimerase